MYKPSGLYLLIFSLSGLLLFQQCQQGPQRQARQMMYFDLTGFLNEQGAYLDTIPTEVKRLNSINGSQEEVNVSQFNWAREVNYLYEADINRPSWQGAFKTDSLLTPSGRLQAIQYLPLEEDIPVKQLTINFNAVSQQVESIEATVKDRNMLYNTGRTMQLRCVPDASGINRASSYTVQGSQKVIFQDSVSFQIAARILYLK